jgi:hypothetical protein
MMHPGDITKKLGDEINAVLSLFLMWRLRDIAGRFPYKVRVTLFFPDPPPHGQVVEFENRYSQEARDQAEGTFQSFEDNQLKQAAQEFLKNPQLFDDQHGNENVE